MTHRREELIETAPVMLAGGQSGNPAQRKERMAKAFAYSRAVGREAAIKEQAELDDQAGRLFERMVALSAKTQAGRPAQVRTLLTFVHTEEWRGPSDNMDTEQRRPRALL